MTNVSKHFLFWCAVELATLLAVPQRLFACSTSYAEITVGREFAVVVVDRGRPVEGVEVRISRSVERPGFHFDTVASQRTDAHGFAQFTGMKKGKYDIAVWHAGLQGSAAYLKVQLSHKRESIGMEWPASNVLAVQTIGGIFHARIYQDTGKGVLDIAYKHEGPFANQPLRLSRASSAHMVAATTTDETGHFNFPSLEPGLYILHVQELTTPKPRHDFDITGDIFIEVVPDAKERELGALELNESSCGLDYKTMEPTAINAQTH